MNLARGRAKVEVVHFLSCPEDYLFINHQSATAAVVVILLPASLTTVSLCGGSVLKE